MIISGGGTGGHIFPAISIANAFKKRFPDSEILFVGADNRMEMEKVPTAGYKIIGLPISGFDRANKLNNIKVLMRLCKSLWIASKHIKQFKPDIAVGVGGYASGPTLRVAGWMGIPTLLQEQNSYAGVTNKLLAKVASRICVAYDGMERFFPKDKIVVTGNPVRQVLEDSRVNKADAYAYFKLDPNKKTILILGGSLGARTINQSVIKHLDKLDQSEIQILWQTGKNYYEDALKAIKPFHGIPVYAQDFITHMDYAYAVADLVISRAGAGSISEFALLGKPVILVPSPNVAEDHQTKNALALVKKDAAVLVTDKEAEAILIDTALKVVADNNKLKTLSRNIETMAQHKSADRIVDEIVAIIEKK